MMIPVVVDPKQVRIALVGRGPAAERRAQSLIEAGAMRLTVFSDAPSVRLEALAGDALWRHLPADDELERFGLIWIADLPRVLAEPLARAARARGILVNVEDVIDLCDFHNPAQVRRGDLLLTVSTGGRSPGVAARIRAELARRFGPEWAGHLNRIADKRQAWRRRPRSLQELTSLTDAAIDAQGWLAAGQPVDPGDDHARPA